jgi:hypothetical protein
LLEGFEFFYLLRNQFLLLYNFLEGIDHCLWARPGFRGRNIYRSPRASPSKGGLSIV